MRVRAPARARAIAADYGKRHEPASATAFEIAEPGSQRQLALIGAQKTLGPDRVRPEQTERHAHGSYDARNSHAMPTTNKLHTDADLTASAATRVGSSGALRS